jgi:hypothetical protein
MKSFVSVKDLDLTASEVSSLDEYTGGESLWINNHLRDRNLHELNEHQKQLMKKYAYHLNNMINKSPPSKNATTVYRGAEAMDEKWKYLKYGSELFFTQKGLISTSFNKSTAIGFIEEYENCCLLILRLPKGTRGLYIASNSMFNQLNEDELLLPHGSKFIVRHRKIYKQEKKEIITYYADLVSQL